MDTVESLRQAWSGVSAPHLAMLVLVAMFVQEELTLAAVGILSSTGDVPLVACALGAVVGILIIDNTAYGVGRYLGSRALDWTPVKRLLAKQSGRGRKLFETRGVQVVFTTRFIPGTRIPTYLMAGSMGMRWPRFLMASALGACLWVPTVIIAGRFVGARLIRLFQTLGANPLVALVGSVVVIVVVLKLIGMRRAIREARKTEG